MSRCRTMHLLVLLLLSYNGWSKLLQTIVVPAQMLHNEQSYQGQLTFSNIILHSPRHLSLGLASRQKTMHTFMALAGTSSSSNRGWGCSKNQQREFLLPQYSSCRPLHGCEVQKRGVRYVQLSPPPPTPHPPAVLPNHYLCNSSAVPCELNRQLKTIPQLRGDQPK